MTITGETGGGRQRAIDTLDFMRAGHVRTGAFARADTCAPFSLKTTPATPTG